MDPRQEGDNNLGGLGIKTQLHNGLNIIAFFSYLSSLSNLHKARFDVNQHRFNCSEQYFMFKHGTPVLEIYNLPIPVRLSRLQIEGDPQKALQLRPGDLAWAHTFHMPQGSRVSHSYWLPNQFPETENAAGETYVHQGDYVALFEYCDLDREQLRLPISYTDHLQNAELITGLATKIYTTSLLELSDKMTLVGSINRIPCRQDENGRLIPQRHFTISHCFGGVGDVVSFLKIWRKDSLVHVFSEMDSKNPCAQGSVVNVSRVEGLRYCVRLNLTGIDRGEDGCPYWEDIADEQFLATI